MKFLLSYSFRRRAGKTSKSIGASKSLVNPGLAGPVELERRLFQRAGISTVFPCLSMYLPVSGWMLFVLMAYLSACTGPSLEESPARPNILFISIDDLRPELGCYGDAHIHSPNMDRLAKQSLVFHRVYAQEPTCGPSRASILTGLRPDSSRVFDIFTPIRSAQPDVLTLPQHFRQNGYTTISLGKIYHHKTEDDSLGWSRPAWKAPLANLRGYLREENIARINPVGNSSFYERMEAPDTAYEDGMTAQKAIETLRELDSEGNPFFLAVGFFKPHLPFIAPEKYWRLYDPDSIKIPEPYALPADRFRANYNYGGEVSSYLDWSRAPRPWGYEDQFGREDSIALFDELTARKLIHGYYASLSYADAQLGKVLDELDRLGLRESTIIILWSDHGWMLGELGEWCKHGLFDLQARATLMLSPPGYQGAHTEAITELLDIYPTLSELAGLPIPEPVQGKSFAHLLDAPQAMHKEAAYTQYPRDFYNNGKLVGEKYFQGYSVRTDHFRYNEWRLASNIDSVMGRELYDYRRAPLEYENVAELPEYSETLEKHKKLLYDQFIKDAPRNKYE